MMPAMQKPHVDAITHFRTVYLRAIALSWVSTEFRRALVKDPIAALHHYFHYTWPWSDALTLKLLHSDEVVWIGDEWSWPSGKADQLKLRIPLPFRLDEVASPN